MNGLKQPLLMDSQWQAKNIGLIIGNLKGEKIESNYAKVTNLPSHSGQKGIFDYFQFCFLVARSMHLNIIRYMRSKKVEIVEFQGRKMNF